MSVKTFMLASHKIISVAFLWGIYKFKPTKIWHNNLKNGQEKRFKNCIQLFTYCICACGNLSPVFQKIHTRFCS